MIKLVKILLITVLSTVLLFVFIVIRLFAIKIVDSQLQIKHMKELNEYYASTGFVPLDESEFIDFDSDDSSIKLNDIQILASHNSYKKKGSALGKFFIGLGDSFEEANALKYGYRNLTDQFDSGIRSMEIDLRLRKTSFMLTHVPLVDNSSVAPDFSMALEEIKLFSDNNPNHIPIIMLMEIKDDWMILDHALQQIGSEQLETLNHLLMDKLGDTLFKPSEMLETDKSIMETITTTGWPSVQSLLGKVIFVLHPGSFTIPYYELDQTLSTQAMFPGVYKDDVDQEYATFVVHNDIDIPSISALVDQGFIVRTRIDDYLIFEQDNYDDAILSGAQILSSDFTIGRSDLNPLDVIYLPNEKMIIRRI
jgi:hypothetical protein